jgi:uncharacterized protein
MKPRIHFLTLGVVDLERSLTFYRDGMGLRTEGITGQEHEDGAIVFFKMHDLTLALYPIAAFAKDAKVAAAKAQPGAVSLGHNVKSKAEVDAVIRQAEAAGAVVTDPPHDRFWGGYSGYFQDPNGHLWEIAWHPHSNVAD